jgi:hypothetical protein
MPSEHLMIRVEAKANTGVLSDHCFEKIHIIRRQHRLAVCAQLHLLNPVSGPLWEIAGPKSYIFDILNAVADVL